jgi:hypothetical protein
VLQAGADRTAVRRAIASQHRWPAGTGAGAARHARVIAARLAALETPPGDGRASPRLLLAALCATLPLLTLPAVVHHLFEALLPLA